MEKIAILWLKISVLPVSPTNRPIHKRLQQYRIPFHSSQKTTAGCSHTIARCIDSSVGGLIFFSCPCFLAHHRLNQHYRSAPVPQVTPAPQAYLPCSPLTNIWEKLSSCPDAIQLESIFTRSYKSWKRQKKQRAVRQN